MLQKIRTILFACDLEPKTNQAMEMALNMAIANQAEIVLMHAIEPVSAQAANMINNYISDVTIKEMREEADRSTLERMQTYLGQFMEAYAEEMKELPAFPRLELAHGAPAEVIEATAEKVGADLIIMNSRTHSRIGQMVIGSTANKVVHHSRVPVMVVPIIN
ncbi:Stress response protein NhaX [Marinomonas gallaica]|uniref:Stress response protein NhaX n=1 Tax=Marinomonas gallaica TaxID=1806667 RepID=A0A1C3JR63_9GAMM|nr:universal stress protein [Marinomonas gallaica]SBT17540.1 Stress response protein NhaX [Marinomonas gallaica]SBT19732.1 Stress response protein NhaX [Marinomonas gallaica]